MTKVVKLPEGSNGKNNDFLNVKNALLSHYQNIASAQTVRLIGFTAGIFTLIGAIQLTPEQHLGEFFSNACILPLKEGIPSSISSSINFLFLSVSISILFFFVFRAIFRYAAYSNLTDALIYVTIEETEKAEGKSLHAKFFNALITHVNKYPRKVFKMPISYFISYTGNTKILWGRALSLFLSILSTFLLLLLIW
jgi:hypothetical protein